MTDIKFITGLMSLNFSEFRLAVKLHFRHKNKIKFYESYVIVIYWEIILIDPDDVIWPEEWNHERYD